MRVVIIGGGVIGLACAYELQKRGADVAVLEAREMGAAASWGNAGWIVPSLSGPVPEPGLTLTALRWLLKPDSPLYIKPRLDPGFIRWLWAFWRHCNQRDYTAGLTAFARLAAPVMDLYDRWQAEGIQFEMHPSGLVFAFLTKEKMDHEVEGFGQLAMIGYSMPELLSGDEVRDLAPMLSTRVVGGFTVERERHVQPGTLTRGLADRLVANGAELRPHTPVTRIRSERGRVVSVRTVEGAVEGDVFLIAAGAWSAALARQAAFRLPVESGKGYSITIERPETGTRRALYLAEPRVGVSPYDGALRFAGTMELSGLSERVDEGRIASLRRSVSDFLTVWPRGEGEITWAGMRPLMPDGLPAMGRAPGYENLFVATGHSMLGVTLAPATGQAMAELICDGAAVVDLHPFDPGRFA
jgi:D-amino-acid dehydrogenase